MCSNCNTNSYNNQSGVVGVNIENGNNAVVATNTGSYNNGDILGASYNNSFCNDVLGINTSYNCGCITNSRNDNSCNCNGNCNTNNCGCNCNGCTNNNNSCSCNCTGNNNLATASIANNNNDNVTNNSLQENLRNFIGRRVTLEFNNCGTCSKKTGVLTCVGCNFLTLKGVNNNSCLLVDTAGLNFVTVHNCG